MEGIKVQPRSRVSTDRMVDMMSDSQNNAGIPGRSTNTHTETVTVGDMEQYQESEQHHGSICEWHSTDNSLPVIGTNLRVQYQDHHRTHLRRLIFLPSHRPSTYRITITTEQHVQIHAGTVDGLGDQQKETGLQNPTMTDGVSVCCQEVRVRVHGQMLDHERDGGLWWNYYEQSRAGRQKPLRGRCTRVGADEKMAFFEEPLRYVGRDGIRVPTMFEWYNYIGLRVESL